MGLYTMIGRGRKDARGQVLDASMRYTIGRLRKPCLIQCASPDGNCISRQPEGDCILIPYVEEIIQDPQIIHRIDISTV
jgi:hypothetical protein